MPGPSSHWLRFGIVIVWILCGAYGAYTLWTSDREMIRFWDEADLVMDIAVPEFVTEGGRIGEMSYATRKIGYAYPVKRFHDWFGDSGYEYYNLLWFAVLLLIPIPGMRRHWIAWLLKIGAVLSLPYTMKYVTMLNPTLQSMALWLSLAAAMTWWKTARDRPHANPWGYSAVVGVIGGLLVLTDFKWSAFVVGGVGLTLIWYRLDNDLPNAQGFGWVFPAIRALIADAVRILIWVPVVMWLVTLVHPPYGEMIYSMLFRVPNELGVVRWGICDNFLIHLWYLGGFWFVVGTVIICNVQRRMGRRIHSQFAPYWIFAALMVTVFTVVLWPRGARMYSSSVVLIIQFGAIIVADLTIQRPPHMLRVAAWAGTGLMTISLLVNVPDVRAALDTPSGLDELKQNVLDHIPYWRGERSQPTSYTYDPPLIAVYFAPVMIVRASGNRDVSWYSPKDGIIPKTNWAVANHALDYVTVIEQTSSREEVPGWEMGPYFVLQSMHKLGQQMDTFPAPFYTTPYYLCETTLESGDLRETIMAHPPSNWEILYIGTLNGRRFPGVETNPDSTEVR